MIAGKRGGLNLSSVRPAAAPATGWTWSCAVLPPICAATWIGKSTSRAFNGVTVAPINRGTENLIRPPLPSEPADEWSLADRFRASFDPERSGDLIVAPRPHITPIIDVSTYVATHGSPWNYDRKVPILFYRPGVVGFEQSLPVETVDILPTLAALIELPVPSAEIDGRCINLDAGTGDSCAFERHRDDLI